MKNAQTTMLRSDWKNAKPNEVREAVRSGNWKGVTHGMARGHIHANMAIVQKIHAFDFLRFCLLNPKPCPLIEVLDAGNPNPRFCAKDADVRTDLSSYRIFSQGKLIEEVPSLENHWKNDHVTFLMGCSLSFDQAMLEAGIPLRHLENENGRIGVYQSNIPCTSAGIFSGNMVVSMRPTKRKLLMQTIEVTSKYPIAHGAPIHIGNPQDIGIHDLANIHSGGYNRVQDDEIPVFWACGVTPQSIAMSSGIDMITHTTGHMFMTDLTLKSAQSLS